VALIGPGGVEDVDQGVWALGVFWLQVVADVEFAAAAVYG